MLPIMATHKFHNPSTISFYNFCTYFKESDMKTIQIMILSLLIATQSFAWGQAEQKALLGFTAGVALTHFISTYDKNTHYTQKYYEPQRESYEYIDARNDTYVQERYTEVRRPRHHHRNRTVYVNNYYNKTYHNERPKHNPCRTNKVIVKNNYRNNYYY